MKRIFLGAVFACLATQLFAQPPSIFGGNQVPSDKRLGDMKTLNGHFPFKVPDNPGQWHDRAEKLRTRVLVANGLWPMPEKTPLQSVIHGKVQRDGFTVEKVYFQSLPGHYVSGLLFRPDPASDKQGTNPQPNLKLRPGVLSPHGHGGRQQKHSAKEIERQIGVGAEHYAESGSMPKLARCAQLARMGCVTFIFDMLGYADSIQISREVAHRHATARPEEAVRPDEAAHSEQTEVGNPDSWVFYSVAADLRLQSIMGLQTWNAIRALDFLASLEDVDPDRLAVTGGSGGGTQSILLGAIDQRIKVSFPNGMVSTSMQGGCYCENCNYLRIGTGNVELAALFAPRPQAMTAANDWTKAMMEDGYPELRWLYAMLGNEEDVYCRPMLHFKHNYNYVTRATMYQWMNRHLKLGLDDPIIEQDFKLLTEAESAVWNDQHPAPKNVGPDHEREVCRWMHDQSNAKYNDQPKSREQLLGLIELAGGALPVLYGVDDLPRDHEGALQIATMQQNVVGETLSGDLVVGKGKLTDSSRGAELPLLTVQSPTSNKQNRIIVWTDGNGKRAAFNADGTPSEMLQKLAAGATVLLPDLLGQGEFTSNQEPVTQQRLIDDKRQYSAFTFGYNRTLVAQRVRDLLRVIVYANRKADAKVGLVATNGAAAWAAPAATFLDHKQIDRTLIDTKGFRFADVESFRDANFVPGAVKYGDIPMLLAFATGEVQVVGESDETIQRINTLSSELPSSSPVVAGKSATSDEAINWLIQ